jgi:thiamine pyrophosphate-dependent acetolactate synthase large subunit-like protein
MPPFEFRTPPTRALLGGDLLAQSLSQLGVDLAFGLHGGHLDAFLVGCAFTVPPIRLVDTRHETPAVQAAESYAKLTGKVGVAFVTANSGFCNALPGLATAFADRSPIFIITSSPPLRDAETNALQGFHDQVVLAKPMSKFAHRCTNVEEIPRIVNYAFGCARQGTPGPVVVDFPIDVLFSPPRSASAISFGGLGMEPPRKPGPEKEGLRRLAEIWGKAERPVVIVGTGAAGLTTGTGEDGRNKLVELAEEMKTPVFYSSKFAPAIPHESGLRGGPAARLAVLPYIGKKRPDVVILLGARTGFLLGGRNHAIIPEDASKLTQSAPLPTIKVIPLHPPQVHSGRLRSERSLLRVQLRKLLLILDPVQT